MNVIETDFGAGKVHRYRDTNFLYFMMPLDFTTQMAWVNDDGDLCFNTPYKIPERMPVRVKALHTVNPEIPPDVSGLKVYDPLIRRLIAEYMLHLAEQTEEACLLMIIEENNSGNETKPGHIKTRPVIAENKNLSFAKQFADLPAGARIGNFFWLASFSEDFPDDLLEMVNEMQDKDWRDMLPDIYASPGFEKADAPGEKLWLLREQEMYGFIAQVNVNCVSKFAPTDLRAKGYSAYSHSDGHYRSFYVYAENMETLFDRVKAVAEKSIAGDFEKYVSRNDKTQQA